MRKQAAAVLQISGKVDVLVDRGNRHMPCTNSHALQVQNERHVLDSNNRRESHSSSFASTTRRLGLTCHPHSSGTRSVTSLKPTMSKRPTKRHTQKDTIHVKGARGCLPACFWRRAPCALAAASCCSRQVSLASPDPPHHHPRCNMVRS